MTTSPSGNNPWFAVSIGLMGLIVGYFAGSRLTVLPVGGAVPTPTQVGQPPAAPEAPAAPTGTPPTLGIGPTLGKDSATITVVEFTDFQCPFCSRHFTQTFSEIKKNYIDTGKVKYEARNFPLTSIHPQAMLAAEAAQCAHKQGKFWEMHDKLFIDQQVWGNAPDVPAALKKYAADMGMNTTTFNKCLDNHETQAEVQKDLGDGGTAGVTGTPGFWIIGPNGKTQQISGAYPYATFQAAFDSML